MKIGMYGRAVQEKHKGALKHLLARLLSGNHQVFLEPEYAVQMSDLISLSKLQVNTIDELDHVSDLDFLFSMGGDGTLLDTLLIVGGHSVPVMGINMGRLGFLTTAGTDQIEECVLALEKGDFTIDKRNVLALNSEPQLFETENYALNEFTIHREDSSTMITIHTYINGIFLNSYWADGLIVATPTGSTAYSLSCGGPIISPQSGNFVITPVAAHNLNVRPFIVSDENELSFKVEGRAGQFLCTLDARNASFEPNALLEIKKADFQMDIVRLPDNNFFSTLRTKMNWGMDNRN
ncbi:UNVERIFIED_CONTAM: hypothetical protein GTU68_046863 [Idotea baltica]|nr:hypothetical protein [Idotea baltica]